MLKRNNPIQLTFKKRTLFTNSNLTALDWIKNLSLFWNKKQSYQLRNKALLK